MSLRRARIKASASHLASLAGKRRVNNQESADEKAKAVSEPKPSPVVEAEKPSEETTTSSSPIIEANVENTSTPEDTLKEQPSVNEDIIPNQPASPANVPPRPLLKSRFRPNLSESDQQRTRLRRISGCEVAASPGTPGRVRTISGSSDDFNVGSPGLVQVLIFNLTTMHSRHAIIIVRSFFFS